MTVKALAEHKQAARTTWATGDYPAVAQRQLWPIGERIVRLLEVAPGEEVLDVACGTGNAAIRAAQAGARATGVDLTPELFDAGRRLAADASVEVEWLEGDAEELPAGDESFDVVLSTFGCMFAPRHEVAARELARVLRPGGRLGICSWTPEGGIGQLFKTIGRHVPPAPDFASPPPLWGDEDHVRRLFAGTGVALSFEREVADFPPFESAEDELEFHLERFGPLMKARELTEAEGRWPALREDLLALMERDEPADYLVVLGRKA